MREEQKKLEFYNTLMDKVQSMEAVSGSHQKSFFQEMLSYMELSDEPEIFDVPVIKTAKKIQLNGFNYRKEENILDLFIVDFNYDDVKEQIVTASMSALLEVANKAKRFLTNAQSLIDEALDKFMPAYDLATDYLKDKSDIEEVNIYVMTNRFYLANKLIELNIPGIENVNVNVWDMDRIYQLSMAEQGIEDFYLDLENDYDQALEMMLVPHAAEKANSQYSFECYIGYIPALLLAKIYDDWGPNLVERNVRSFLQARGGTNKGIRDTLKDTEQRQLFVAYNNGISSVARSSDIEQIDGINLYRIKGLKGWQIVNGGQTTASIHQAYKSDIDLSDVYVQAKLTILSAEADEEKDQHLLEDEMVSKISEYANTQNKINKSDLLANTRFMSDIEKFSRNTWVPAQDGRKADKKWYFERSRGQYTVDIGRRKKGKEQNDFKKQYPKELVLVKVDLAKHFMSWNGFPHVSSKGGEEAFKKFMNFHSAYWNRDSNEDGSAIKKMDANYYKILIAHSIIYKHVAGIVNELKLKGYRANVIYYTTAMLQHVYGKQIDLLEVWQKQDLDTKWNSIIYTIASFTVNYLKDSAGDRNVTQWAKQEDCWKEFKENFTKQVSELV